MSQKLSFFRYFHLMAIAVFLLFSVAFFGFSFYNIKHKFYSDVAALKESYFQTQKELLQKEVNRFIEEIDQKRRSAYANTQRLVRARVDEAYNVAVHIYEENKDKHSPSQIQERIIQTLRMLRYEHNKGYFFILDLNGTAMLLTNHPEMEGKTLLNVHNIEGRCIAKGMIDIAQTMSEGYYEYLWSKPFEEADNHKKISYVKWFEPFDWLIGTGYYVEDTESQIRQEILADERRFHFDDQQDGYVFIGTWEGFSLSYPAPNRNMYDLQDAQGKRVVQELIQTAKSGGGFVEYVMPPLKNEKALPKLSYVRAYPDWRWYVGAGVYVDKIEQDIAQLEAKMYDELKAMLSSIGIWILLFIATVWTVYFYLNRRLRKDFETFIAFFDSLSSKDRLIDTQSLKFKEFEELALHANTMLTAKIHSNKHLEQYKKIVSSSEDFLALIDRHYTYLAISEAYLSFFDKEKEAIVGHTMPELFGEQYFAETLKPMSDRVLCGETFESEYWVLSSFGKRFLHAKYFPYYEQGDKLPSAYVVSARDNTEKKANEERLIASEKALEFLAHNDVLTGLPNRLLLNDRIAHAIENSKRHMQMIAVCFMDLDNFKKINDSFGHSYGDEILKQFALRVQHKIRHCDTLSRIGGDEFVLVIESINERAEVEVILRKIQTIFEEPFINKDQKFFLTASIGVSLYPDHGTEGETLIKNADAAMYKAKDAGKNAYAFYTIDMTVASYERIGMGNALREAVKKEQILVYYQPQIDLQTRELVGVEALVRWRHPLEGILAPGRFIAYAEETRLIVEIGAWVLRQTCLDWVAWHEEGLFSGTVSVNISGVQIEFSDFLQTLKTVLDETKIDPSVIEMEVTESILMHDPKRWIMLLKEMQSLGLNIAIDDFGTGYSSLSYLRKLPINKLKVDMSFVKDLPDHEDACAIADSIIQLSRSMKITTLAEGIEHEAQERFLAEHGCAQGQGYLYAKPMSIEDLRQWIRQRTTV
ncbi:cache domain-containing protein [Sulfurospirillum cavolei]|uniref:bifunctional diguanylate cyclase/phosphodiesterase n=1 Tax=Sulfurospirillum cavolei TaxID=366522 RepID=UPI003FA2AC6E